ncbi:hypothetical protein Tco_1345475 [Tanacetum coccineum]
MLRGTSGLVGIRSMDQVDKSQDFKVLKGEYFWCSMMFLNDFIQMKDVFGIDLVVFLGCNWHQVLKRFIRCWVVGGERQSVDGYGIVDGHVYWKVVSFTETNLIDGGQLSLNPLEMKDAEGLSLR